MRLVILGAGGYGRTIADLAEQSKRYSEIVFLDDNDINAAGKCSEAENYIDTDTEIYPAFGNNELRMKWIRFLTEKNAEICSLVHSSAYVSPTAILGKGTVVLPNASIGTNAVIGMGCIINMNAAVDHDCLIEDGVHICLGAIVKAGIHIQGNIKVEAGAVITNDQLSSGGI